MIKEYKMKKLEQFDFMGKVRRKEKFQKLFSSLECISTTITAVSVSGTLAIMLFYDKVPSVYETFKEYVKYLFN